MLIFFALSCVISKRSKKSAIYIAIFVTTIVIYWSGLALATFLQPRTVYFVVNTPRSNATFIDETKSLLKLLASSSPPDTEFGLAVVGSGLTFKDGCEDVKEIIKTSHKEESLPRISENVTAIRNINRINKFNLQKIIEYSIDRLEGRSGVQQIFFWTSELDFSCGILDRKPLNELARQKNIEIEIHIFLLGQVSERDKELMNKFTYGNFTSSNDPNKLEEVAKSVINSPPSTNKANEVYYGR